ncbi:hypothetical protein BLNAU_15956 [Blattamonas nauphoetae]|uniref:Uncharacterized protein n=1 Tax=Blattamonas nauphoetae TaxID=2049346 RepID=A0ABQ9XCN9_9EUKA|nr:hypothetical protein BLNAU_15956 [Blattamonas nauphoetae]
MWIKIRLVQAGKKPKIPVKVTVANPNQSFLTDSFIQVVSTKLGILPSDLKSKYTFVYQANGMNDTEGHTIQPKDTFFSLKLLDGASFLCQEKALSTSQSNQKPDNPVPKKQSIAPVVAEPQTVQNTVQETRTPVFARPKRSQDGQDPSSFNDIPPIRDSEQSSQHYPNTGTQPYSNDPANESFSQFSLSSGEDTDDIDEDIWKNGNPLGGEHDINALATLLQEDDAESDESEDLEDTVPQPQTFPQKMSSTVTSFYPGYVQPNTDETTGTTKLRLIESDFGGKAVLEEGIEAKLACEFIVHMIVEKVYLKITEDEEHVEEEYEEEESESDSSVDIKVKPTSLAQLHKATPKKKRRKLLNVESLNILGHTQPTLFSPSGAGIEMRDGAEGGGYNAEYGFNSNADAFGDSEWREGGRTAQDDLEEIPTDWFNNDGAPPPTALPLTPQIDNFLNLTTPRSHGHNSFRALVQPEESNTFIPIAKTFLPPPPIARDTDFLAFFLSNSSHCPPYYSKSKSAETIAHDLAVERVAPEFPTPEDEMTPEMKKAKDKRILNVSKMILANEHPTAIPAKVSNRNPNAIVNGEEEQPSKWISPFTNPIRSLLGEWSILTQAVSEIFDAVSFCCDAEKVHKEMKDELAIVEKAHAESIRLATKMFSEKKQKDGDHSPSNSPVRDKTKRRVTWREGEPDAEETERPQGSPLKTLKIRAQSPFNSKFSPTKTDQFQLTLATNEDFEQHDEPAKTMTKTRNAKGSYSAPYSTHKPQTPQIVEIALKKMVEVNVPTMEVTKRIVVKEPKHVGTMQPAHQALTKKKSTTPGQLIRTEHNATPWLTREERALKAAEEEAEDREEDENADVEVTMQPVMTEQDFDDQTNSGAMTPIRPAGQTTQPTEFDDVPFDKDASEILATPVRTPKVDSLAEKEKAFSMALLGGTLPFPSPARISTLTSPHRLSQPFPVPAQCAVPPPNHIIVITSDKKQCVVFKELPEMCSGLIPIDISTGEELIGAPMEHTRYFGCEVDEQTLLVVSEFCEVYNARRSEEEKKHKSIEQAIRMNEADMNTLIASDGQPTQTTALPFTLDTYFSLHLTQQEVKLIVDRVKETGQKYAPKRQTPKPADDENDDEEPEVELTKLNETIDTVLATPKGTGKTMSLASLLDAAEELQCTVLLFYLVSHALNMDPAPVSMLLSRLQNSVWLESFSHSELLLSIRQYSPHHFLSLLSQPNLNRSLLLDDPYLINQAGSDLHLDQPLCVVTPECEDLLWFVRYAQAAQVTNAKYKTNATHWLSFASGAVFERILTSLTAESLKPPTTTSKRAVAPPLIVDFSQPGGAADMLQPWLAPSKTERKSRGWGCGLSIEQLDLSSFGNSISSVVDVTLLCCPILRTLKVPEETQQYSLNRIHRLAPFLTTLEKL